jgi:hypothetical protein
MHLKAFDGHLIWQCSLTIKVNSEVVASVSYHPENKDKEKIQR